MQDRRREAFVAAAEAAFRTHGYGATAMSAIAAAVGGSKTTLWTYFPSKAALFEAVIDDVVERYGRSMAVPLDPAMPLVDALRDYGRTMLGIIFSPTIVDLHRLVLGEAGRFPELGTMMYERGPKRGLEKLTLYFTHAMADGRMRMGDAEVAARHFAGLCKADLHLRSMLGLIAIPDEALIATTVEEAIDTFLNGWR